MQSLKELGIKIQSFENVRKITRSMHMIATSKLRQPLNFVTESRIYYQMMNEMVAHLLGIREDLGSGLFLNGLQQKTNQIAVVLITSDMGLAGSFNYNLVKATLSFLKAHQNKEIFFYLIGRKARSLAYHLDKAPNVVSFKEGVFKKFDAIEAYSKETSDQILTDFEKRRYDEIYVVFSRYRSMMSQQPTVKRLLPLEAEQLEGKEESKTEARPYLFEDDDPQKLVQTLIREYLDFYFLYAFMNSFAGENASRAVTMDSAVNNANKLIAEYTLQKNRARQAKITTEITEIVSGATLKK